MLDFAILLIIPIAVTVVGLAIEYWVIQPWKEGHLPLERRGKAGVASRQPTKKSDTITSQRSSSGIGQGEVDSKPPISKAYYILAILFISSTSGLASAVLLRLVSETYYEKN